MSTTRPVTRLETEEPATAKSASVTPRTDPVGGADTAARVMALKKRYPKILARLAE